jgi:hypothetical protein
MAHNKKEIAALETHLQHELKTLQGDGLRQTINEEISALFEWLEEVSLNDFLTARQVQECFQRNVIELPISDEIIAFLTECAKRIHSCMGNDDTKLEGILTKEQYDKLIEKLIELEDLRNEIINQVVSSSIFSMVITNTLYGGIKEFIVSENILMKNIPGASSLLKIGMELMNKTTLGLASSIDEKMKEFVESNIQNILKDNERFLVESLDEKLLRELGNELWDAASKYNAHSATEYVNPEHIESIAPIVKDIWLHFRKNTILSKMCNTLVEYFFERNGDKKVRTFLEEIGITKDVVLDELNEIAVPVLEKDVVSNYREKRIRARLEAYYFSERGKAPARKSTPKKKPSKTSATDSVLTVIKGSRRGVTTAQIKEKTGFSDTKIRSTIYRLKKQDKIKSKGRGVYIKA